MAADGGVVVDVVSGACAPVPRASGVGRRIVAGAKAVMVKAPTVVKISPKACTWVLLQVRSHRLGRTERHRLTAELKRVVKRYCAKIPPTPNC
jgi:hypothetical protein